MNKGIRFTDEFKQDAVAQVVERGYAYVLKLTGVAHKAALTRAFLVRKMEEYEALSGEIEALKVEVHYTELKST